MEDELHFVFQCRLYEALTERAKLYIPQFCQRINSFNFLEDIEKFRLIWRAGNGRAIYLLGVFLLKAFQVKQKFIRNHSLAIIEYEFSHACWAFWPLSDR